MGKFSADITKWVKKTRLRADVVLQKLAFDGFANVVKLTPVRTGRARGNWRIGINRIVATVSDATRDKAPLGAPPTNANRALAKLRRAKFGVTVHISNGLPYIQRLERGYSKQSSAMLSQTFQILRNFLKSALEAAKRKHP